jgi:hypothetical protein
MSARKQPLNGTHVSRNSVPTLKKNTRARPTKLERKLAAIYDLYQRKADAKSNARSRQFFVSNMTDWIDDLAALSDFYRNPERFDKKAAGEIVAGFVCHVIPHLTAAGRLLLDYTPGDQFRKLEERTPIED